MSIVTNYYFNFEKHCPLPRNTALVQLMISLIAAPTTFIYSVHSVMEKYRTQIIATIYEKAK